MSDTEFQIRAMTDGDHAGILALMRATPGIRIRTADGVDATRFYLQRNPGLSFVAERGADITGCAMAGHDGRRGYMQHVIVAPRYRRRGLARALVGRCVSALGELGIEKIHLDVMVDNHEAMRFWEHLGWCRRDDLVRYSLITSGDPNA